MRGVGSGGGGRGGAGAGRACARWGHERCRPRLRPVGTRAVPAAPAPCGDTSGAGRACALWGHERCRPRLRTVGTRAVPAAPAPFCGRQRERVARPQLAALPGSPDSSLSRPQPHPQSGTWSREPSPDQPLLLLLPRPCCEGDQDPVTMATPTAPPSYEEAVDPLYPPRHGGPGYDVPGPYPPGMGPAYPPGETPPYPPAGNSGYPPTMFPPAGPPMMPTLPLNPTWPGAGN
ncbi:basic proline-rich protein-like, partial [Leucoraja erinacea]|uniref:basic proline-rich protein-like n=1 Tax=Leucoraja erinaceus TaxID=7782 RepID=UPI002453A1DB